MLLVVPNKLSARYACETRCKCLSCRQKNQEFDTGIEIVVIMKINVIICHFYMHEEQERNLAWAG